MKTYPICAHVVRTLLLLLVLQAVEASLSAQGRGQGVKRPDSEQRVALVIGNGAYLEGKLANPVNDAQDVATRLRQLDFEVISGNNLNRRQMEDLIREFGRKIRNGGVGMFYFAGHGVQVNNNNYLIPIGAQINGEAEVKYEAVDVGFVLAQMENAQNRLNIVILDACRNNPFARSFRSSSRGLASIDAPVGTLIAYATAPGQTASDGKERNGLYTKELLAAMQVTGLKLEDVFKRVLSQVRRQSNDKQVPWYSSSIEGDFYFVGGPADAASLSSKQRVRHGNDVPNDNTPGPIRPQPQTKPKVKTAESNFFRFDLIGCRISGATIVCDLTVTNTDNVDKELMLRPGWGSDGTRAWDNFGNAYDAEYPQLANSTNSTAVITIGTSPKVRLVFKNKGSGATGATKLSKLEIVCNSGGIFRVSFRDICLVDNCDDRSMNLPSESPQRSYTASSAERTFTIPANQQWFDTGIDVEPGMRLEVVASGTISLGQGRNAGPGGVPGFGAANLFFPMKSAYMGALIAKLRYPNGKESKKVAVGARNSLLVDDNESGRLFLGINDSTMSDNEGSFSVTVRW